MNIGRKYTFWEFLQKNSIVIPIIQRDYAQGRKGKEILRNNFLGSLKKALISPNKLVLDFVFGMTQKDGLIPLDGQQRLTSLWLLHWYVYLKKNSRKKYFQESDYKVFNNFTYQTRVSSRQFCEELCKVENIEKLTKSTNIRNDILNQTWFLSEWEQDPTVKAMLNMLGGDNSIESVFYNCDFVDLWNKLTNRDQCPLFFYYLNLDDEILQEPDDIYIKMNARGEQLTDFENFKADLIKFVRDAKNKDEWSCILVDNQFKNNPEIGLSKLIDTDWTDIFWTNLDDEQKKDNENLPSIDKQFFAFLNRYFLNVIFSSDNNVITEKKIKEENNEDPKVRLFKYIYGKDGKGDVSFAYKDFKIFEKAGVITPDIFKMINTIFDVIKNKKNKEYLEEYLKPKWEEKKDVDFVFLPKIGSANMDKEMGLHDISQRHRVVFFGICCYLENCNNPQDLNEDDSFKEWMRFVWNMARNSDIQTVESMIGSIKKLQEVKENSHSIITYLASQSELSSPKSYRDRQWNEEIIKARIYDKKKSIEKAESIFHGSIKFLIDNDNILEQYIDKAKDLIQQTGNKDYLWITKILPYFNPNLFIETPDAQLVFSNDENDIVKTINNDNINKVNYILEAVQNYLKKDFNKVTDNCWMAPLTYNDGKRTLFNYSNSCRIRKYFISPKENEKTCVFLYKGKQWKKDDCILLASEDEYLQEMINKRNIFIKQKLYEEEWELCIEDDNLDKEKISPEDENKHYGRAIVLKKGEQLYYCAVNGYYYNSSDICDY